MRGILTVLITCTLVSVAVAEEKRIGGWLLRTELDRFSDQTNVIALTSVNGGLIALRCLHGDPSIALSQSRAKYTAGDTFGIEMRVDRQPIVETQAVAIDDVMLEIKDHAFDIIKQSRDGRELAVRITGEMSINTIVFNLANAPKVVDPLLKACPTDVSSSTNRQKSGEPL